MDEQATLGQRVADKVASFGGSWTFIFIYGSCLLAWILANTFVLYYMGHGENGAQFDPYQHEAVAHVPSDQPEGTVITEHQKAYRLHDKLIRPALVTVSSGSEGKEKN